MGHNGKTGEIGENCLRCVDSFPNHFGGRLCPGCVLELAQHLATERDIREFCGQQEEDESDDE